MRAWEPARGGLGGQGVMFSIFSRADPTLSKLPERALGIAHAPGDCSIAVSSAPRCPEAKGSAKKW